MRAEIDARLRVIHDAMLALTAERTGLREARMRLLLNYPSEEAFALLRRLCPEAMARVEAWVSAARG